MLTVTELAKECGISRTSVLYYERVGLLEAARRSENGYRWYGPKEVETLKNIMSYRSFGLPIKQIASLLNSDNKFKQQQALHQQFNTLEREIQSLRQQQQALLLLLEEPTLIEKNQLSKERWVAIMSEAGFDEQAMQNWHVQFEKREPDAHQEFLESLGIPEAEISRIRQDSIQD